MQWRAAPGAVMRCGITFALPFPFRIGPFPLLYARYLFALWVSAGLLSEFACYGSSTSLNQSYDNGAPERSGTFHG